MLRLFLLIPFMLLVLACEEEASVVSTATPNPETGETPALDAPTPDVLSLAIGDTAQVGDARVTVHAFRSDPGTEFLQPDAGEQWIVVDVTLENTGDDEYALSSLLQTAIRDSANREHTELAFADTTGTFDGTIPAGQSLRGERAYTVPADAAGLQFVFKQAFGDQQARWNLQG